MKEADLRWGVVHHVHFYLCKPSFKQNNPSLEADLELLLAKSKALNWMNAFLNNETFLSS